jgi:poly-gamma-glutamate synthesis protein (capsule biosynthesis protein)
MNNPRIQESRRSNEILIRAVGDLLLGDGHYHIGDGVGSTISREGPDFPFANVARFLRQADVCVGNLEVPLSNRSEAKGIQAKIFRGTPECSKSLGKAGFTALSIANNHMLDHGESALQDTLLHLDTAGILAIGLRTKMGGYECEPGILSVRGQRLALLGYWISEKSSRSIAVGSEKIIAQDLLKTDKEYRPDWKIVSLHWGNEYTQFPSPQQIQLAEHIVSASENVIVLGHHPHVTQGIESRGNSLIAYSLGNFVFDADFSHDVKRGMILSVLLTDKQLKSYYMMPITIGTRHQPRISNERSGQLDAISKRVLRYRNASVEEYARYARGRMLNARLKMWFSLLRRNTHVSRESLRYLLLRKIDKRNGLRYK